jgi:hypothetical protein
VFDSFLLLDTSERIAKVKEAEAMAETLYLQGLGTSKKRAAIAQGLKISLREHSSAQCNQDAVEVLLLSQYFDTLAAVGADQMIIRTGISDFSEREGSKSDNARGSTLDLGNTYGCV